MSRLRRRAPAVPPPPACLPCSCRKRPNWCVATAAVVGGEGSAGEGGRGARPQSVRAMTTGRATEPSGHRALLRTGSVAPPVALCYRRVGRKDGQSAGPGDSRGQSQGRVARRRPAVTAVTSAPLGQSATPGRD